MFTFLCGVCNIDYNSNIGLLSINSLKFGNYPILFFISGITGTLMVMSLSQLLLNIYKSKILLVLSNGTMVVLGFHKIIYRFFVGMVESDNFWFAIVFSLFILMLSLGLIFISGKYFPTLLGGRKLRKVA